MIEYEPYPRMLARRGSQERVPNTGAQTPRVVGGRGRGRGGKDYMSKSREYGDSTSASREETRIPLTEEPRMLEMWKERTH